MSTIEGLEYECQEHACDERDDPRDYCVPHRPWSHLPFTRHGTVEKLNNRSILCFRDSCLLKLLGEKRDEHFLDLYFASEPGELQPDLGNTHERHGKISPFPRVVRSSNFVPVLHLPELAVHLVDATTQRDDFWIGVGGEVAHDLQLDFRSHDLAFEACGGFDGTLRLVLQNYRPVLLLEPSHGLLGNIEVDACSGQLSSQECPLAPRFTCTVTRDQLVQ